MKDKEPVTACQYIQNPDVILKEEDTDGALIFNPDTDQIRVLNPTGFFIWQLCDGSRDLDGITLAVNNFFEAVPRDQVSGQVKEFVNEMVAAGFIGTVEDDIVNQ
ncbi:MAG: PqqD family peptide modification chaperone [Deltaproteobacteria bacterium]|nr:PqqD family peptide modification chaperone [Deltaproteobacteria bacterium]MBW1861933.1 PqqD family peptide modification chaperone [Deltaproteobacteria bacterium]